jgi:2-methylcitrate dehydratase PrpD
VTVGALTRPLAANAAEIVLGRLPPEVVAKAKLCVLDALGCGLGGASHDVIASLLEAVRPQPVEAGRLARRYGAAASGPGPRRRRC